MTRRVFSSLPEMAVLLLQAIQARLDRSPHAAHVSQDNQSFREKCCEANERTCLDRCT
jgi:hypothetical protein